MCSISVKEIAAGSRPGPRIIDAGSILDGQKQPPPFSDFFIYVTGTAQGRLRTAGHDGVFLRHGDADLVPLDHRPISTWYAGSTLFAYAVVLALAGYAFHTAVAGRSLFKAGFLDAD